MTRLTKSTLRMLTVRSGLARKELSEEAMKLLELYEDPDVTPEQKLVVKAELDEAIRKLEERVTTRRLNEARGVAGAEPPVP